MESIHKIPVHEAFDKRCGCPVCALFDRYENNAINILMEEGVMEPMTRVKTNEQGFCTRHVEMITSRRDSLSLSLMTSSRIGEILKAYRAAGTNLKKLRKTAAWVTDGCYICDGLTKLMNECAEAISMIYAEEPEFRESLRSQEFFCMTHTRLLFDNIRMPQKLRDEYIRDIVTVNDAYAAALVRDLDTYSESFDYRNRGSDVSAVKDASKRAGKFLR